MASPKAHLLEPSMRPYALSIGLSVMTLLAVGCKSGDLEDSGGSGVGEDSRFTVTPPAGGLGQSMAVTVLADTSAFEFGATSLDFGAGILVESVTVQDGWTAVADILIEPDADIGQRDVTVEISGSTSVLDRAFRVTEEFFTVTPDRGKLGETVDVELVGTNTRWKAGRTWANFGDGVDVLDVSVISETLLNATISIDADAPPGLRDVYTEDSGKIVTLYDGFQVDRIALGAVFDPVEAEQGDTVEFTVFARGTNFLQDETTITFFDGDGLNPDIRVDSITVLDAENLWGRMTLSNAAELGLRDVLLTTADEGLRIPDAFTVIGGDYSLDEVAIDLRFTVVRGLDNSSGGISESVQASCVFFIPLDPPCPSGGGMGSKPEPSPYDTNAIGPITGSGSSSEDCPNPTTFSAGDYVWLESDKNIVTLEKQVDAASGMISYVGVGLTLADYVPDNVYDLHLQGDPDGLAEEIVERVLPTVPSDWSMISPQLWGNYTHDRTQDFVYSWTPAMTYPDAIFITSISGTTWAETGDPGLAISIPWDDGEHTYFGSELINFDPNPVSFTAYSYIEGPEFGLKNSIYQENQSESYIYLGASMVLK